MKKKVLFLTHQIPYPKISGGLFKTFKLIERLSEEHDLTLFVTDPDCSAEDEQMFLREMKLHKFHRLPYRLPRTAMNFLRSLAAGRPLSVYRNWSHEIAIQARLLANRSDVIFVDHFLMFQYVPRNFKGTVILHQHNAEYVMWQGYSREIQNPVLKLLLNLEAKRIASYEKDIGTRADWVLCSPNDKQKLSEIGVPESRFRETLHLGDAALLDRPLSQFNELEDRILFVGTLSWEANVHGLKWFLEETWPLIKASKPDVFLDIVGKCPDEGCFSSWQDDPQIKWHGFVEDLNPLYDKAKVFIAPLKFGSGIKVKVVNALYRGIPAVTTSVGIEGLAVRNTQEIYWADSPEEYARNILTLMENQKAWELTALSGRDFAREHLSWDKALSCLKEIV